MSWLFASIYDPFMRSAENACLSQWRAELLARAGGDVLEIGAGTGANLPFYLPAVRSLQLTEPDPDMLARLRRRMGLRLSGWTRLLLRRWTHLLRLLHLRGRAHLLLLRCGMHLLLPLHLHLLHIVGL